MELVVREYRQEDFERTLNLDDRPSKRRAARLKMVGHGFFYCYVAEWGRDILGFVIMENLGEAYAKNHYMVQINVAEKRRGFGRSLVKKVFEEIGSGGHISLCVNTDNHVAINFYEALGFVRSGFTEGYRKDQNKYWYQIDL